MTKIRGRPVAIDNAMSRSNSEAVARMGKIVSLRFTIAASKKKMIGSSLDSIRAGAGPTL